MNGTLKGGVEAVLTFVNGQRIVIAEGSDVVAAVGLLEGVDPTGTDQFMVLRAMIEPRVKVQIVEGTEGDEEPELEEITIERVTEEGATVMITELLGHVESDATLFSLAEAVLDKTDEAAGLVSLAKQVVARVEGCKREKAAFLLDQAAALKVRAKALEQQAGEAVDNSASKVAGATRLKKAGELL